MADKSDNAKATVNRSDSAEKEVGKGTSVPDADNLKAQARALENYKISGIVGDYVDPTRDQEWDIAPEFGVGPHPELQNVAPPNVGFGLGAPAPQHGERSAAAVKALSQDEKEKRAKEVAKQAGDKPVSVQLAAGRPDLRGNESVNAANAEADKKDK